MDWVMCKDRGARQLYEKGCKDIIDLQMARDKIHVGDILSVYAPVVSISHNVDYILIPARVITKYPYQFRVEAVDKRLGHRKWCVPYVELISEANYRRHIIDAERVREELSFWRGDE